MRFQPFSDRRADVLNDPHLRDLFSARPELVPIIDAYLWSYPRSPHHSRRSLAILATLGITIVIAASWAIRAHLNHPDNTRREDLGGRPATHT